MKAILVFPVLTIVVFLSLADPARMRIVTSLANCDSKKLQPLDINPTDFPDKLVGFLTAQTIQMIPVPDSFIKNRHMLTVTKINETRLQVKSQADFINPWMKGKCLEFQTNFKINKEKKRLEATFISKSKVLYLYLIGGSIKDRQIGLFALVKTGGFETPNKNAILLVTFKNETVKPDLVKDAVLNMCGPGFDVGLKFFDFNSIDTKAKMEAHCNTLDIGMASHSSCVPVSYMILSICLSYHFFEFLL